MGVSTDAILAFGWDLGTAEDIELDWFDDEDEDDGFGKQAERRLLAELAGFTEEWSAENAGFFDRQRDAKAKIGVEIIYHCSYDCPMFVLAATGSEVRAWRGDPQPIGELVEDPAWREKLARAKVALGLDLTDDPAWHLFSMWG